MIISHKYRYLYIQIPHTASSAIGRELCDMYDGSKILKKHSQYYEFKKQATEKEKKYFVFANVRNPLDEAVSMYFKLKTNHKGNYTNPKLLLMHGGRLPKRTLRKYNFIQRTNADFSTYFKKFPNYPRTGMIRSTRQACDFIIHFENLQDDFSKVLKLIGIEQKRPLPHINPTKSKDQDYLFYFNKDIIDKAKKIYGPFMKKWGYHFPTSWGNYHVSYSSKIIFNIIDILKDFIHRYLFTHTSIYGRLFRRLY
jgi:hypothetical protein